MKPKDTDLPPNRDCVANHQYQPMGQARFPLMSEDATGETGPEYLHLSHPPPIWPRVFPGL